MKEETFIDDIIKRLEEYRNSKYIEGFMDAILYIKLLQKNSKDIAQFYVKFNTIYNHCQRLGGEIEELPSVTPQESRWIPIVTRPLTEEERKDYGVEIEFIYDCVLPEDGQDVLVTTPYGVRQTTFYTDYGCYFENYEDEGDVIAWCELPQPYKADKEENNER